MGISGWHCKTSGISREDSGGIGQIWGGIANFLAVIFLLAAASRAALFALGSSFLAVVAFAACNALLLSAVCGIRYRRGPPTVRNTHSVLKKASCGTRRPDAAIAWLALIRGCSRMQATVRGCDYCRSGSGGGCYGLARIAKLCLIPVSRHTIAE